MVHDNLDEPPRDGIREGYMRRFAPLLTLLAVLVLGGALGLTRTRSVSELAVSIDDADHPAAIGPAAV